MAPRPRDNFSKAVRTQLAASASHRCCKPDCRAATFSVRRDGSVYTIGEAGHITGAASGGPRYDANLTPAERKSDENGLWLCGNCHTSVDSDDSSYSVETLRQWKSAASKNTREALGRSNTVSSQPAWIACVGRCWQRMHNIFVELELKIVNTQTTASSWVALLAPA